MLQAHQQAFQTAFLAHADEKCRSFRDDLAKAQSVELMDVQIQLNRLVAGVRPIQAFVDSVDRTIAAAVGTLDERDAVAHSALQLFLMETRPALAEVEREFESMGTFEDKLLDAFGESRASCQLAAIFQCISAML